MSLTSIRPLQYVHLLDTNRNITRMVVGPAIYTVKQHESVILGPVDMVVVPPNHYVVVKNPVSRDEADKPVYGPDGFAIRHGEKEIRLHGPPFPLYPGEELDGAVKKLRVVGTHEALRIRVHEDYEEEISRQGEKGKEVKVVAKRVAGEEFLFQGPATYVPKVQEEIITTDKEKVVKAIVVKSGHALKLGALRSFVDRTGVQRHAGDLWLWSKPGAYMPDVWEEVVEHVAPSILTELRAVRVKATRAHTDQFGRKRKAGTEWLVTYDQTASFLPGVCQEIVGYVDATVLARQNYCYVLDPVDKEGQPQLGIRELRRGPAVFFLQPFERLEGGRIRSAYVLQAYEALLLKAIDDFEDEGGVKRKCGEVWMVRGPAEVVPSINMQVVKKRQAIPLDENEGIYVRDTRSGDVRLETNKTYMMEPHEELWEKPLSVEVERLIAKKTGRQRDKTRAVTFRARHNSAVQIYDYRTREGRIVFGPSLIMLGPNEQVTVWSLSGDKPKRPHVVKSLELLLGPEFMTDIFVVETSDHAKLSLKLSYSWRFAVDKTDKEQYSRTFSVPDFVGMTCQAIASKVRGAVAAVPFDEFHKRSAKIIRSAVFGVDEEGKVKSEYEFRDNNLRLTNIDIQDAAPVDQRTRESLVKSVQQAIEITTEQQEAQARHEAARADRVAKGKLQRQKLQDDAEAEKLKQQYIALETNTKTVEQVGEATATAEAKAKTMEIQAETEKIAAVLEAEATLLLTKAQLEEKRKREMAVLAHKKAMLDQELQLQKQLAEVEASKFNAIVTSMGPDTIKDIARAGPEMQARLLKSMGLKSLMITDSNSPINLFGTAQGLVAKATAGSK